MFYTNFWGRWEQCTIAVPTWIHHEKHGHMVNIQVDTQVMTSINHPVSAGNGKQNNFFGGCNSNSIYPSCGLMCSFHHRPSSIPAPSGEFIHQFIIHSIIHFIHLEVSWNGGTPQSSISGWWFGTCSIFPYIGNNHPNRLTHIFPEGWGKTTNHIYILPKRC